MPEMSFLAIDIGINPVLFNIESFEIGWHGIMVVLAVIVGIGTSMWLAKGSGIKREDIYGLAPWAVLGGILGARLFHVVDQLGYYIDHPGDIVEFWHGLSILGAILGGTLAAAIYAKITRISLERLADTLTPGLILALMVGRIGCIINGDVFGKPTTLPLAFVYHDMPGVYAQPLDTPLHPSPLYEMIWCLVVLAIVWRLRRKLKSDGSLFLLFLILYSAGRFGIEFTRGVSEQSFEIGGWHTPHFIALVTLAVCIPLLVYRMKRARLAGCRSEIEDV
jgi:phosphatidylglycerol:prolipoprotein diacylglycerol transferase